MPTKRQSINWTNDGEFTDAYMRHSASMRYLQHEISLVIQGPRKVGNWTFNLDRQIATATNHYYVYHINILADGTVNLRDSNLLITTQEVITNGVRPPVRYKLQN